MVLVVVLPHALRRVRFACVAKPATDIRVGAAVIHDILTGPLGGVLIDTARHFLPVPTILRQIDALVSAPGLRKDLGPFKTRPRSVAAPPVI